MIATAVLMRLGMSKEQALATVSSVRRVDVPDTQVQLDWLNQFT